MSKQIDFFEFQRKFSTDLRCYKFLLKQRWPNGFVCARCGHKYYSYHSTRKLFQCKNCGYQVSVTAGTIFHKTRTPLKKWFWMIYLLSTNKTGYSISYLQRILKIKSYKTAWAMAHKIHKAMQEIDSSYTLQGIIEMDDSYFGSKNVSGKRGRGALNKTPVVVAVGKKEIEGETRPTFVKMEVLDNLRKEQIESFVFQKIVRDKSFIETDKYSSYKWLERKGYNHFPIRIYNPKETLKYLPWVHIIIGNVKGVLKGVHHGVSPKHLQRYLAEFCYKFNRRYFEQNIFFNLFSACVNTKTITLAELRA